MSNFFEELGRAASRQIAQNIDAGRLTEMQSSALHSHISGPMARDSMPPTMKDPPMTRNMARILGQDSADLPIGSTEYNQDPNGSQDPDNGNGHGGSAEQCLGLAQQLLDGFDDPDEKAQFIEGLNNMVQGQDGNGGSANMPANMDRGMRSGNRSARDQGLPNNNLGALDRRRRNGARDNRTPGAMDSQIRGMNTANFLKRFPMMAKIKVMG